MKKHCIIVAGGSSVRMETKIPKQFLVVAGKPVLMHTMEGFFHYQNNINLVLVLPANQIKLWKELCKQFSYNRSYKVVEGGPTRYHSVQNGLRAITSSGLVAVHDGVRPVMTDELLNNCFVEAAKTGNAVPCVPIPESVRKITSGGNTKVDRSQYVLIQTPQVFDKDLLETAFSQPYNESFTDEASMIEELGHQVHLIRGDPQNIKITTGKDLLIAEALLQKSR